MPMFIEVDRSEIEVQFGSVRFDAQSRKNGLATVSSQLVIVMSEPTNRFKFTTVFGRVIEGFALCKRISEMDLTRTDVSIASCGIA